jgi:hypothetical protein
MRAGAVICQCQFCGRVRIDGVWVWDATVEPDVVGHCPTCGALRLRASRITYAREGKRLLRQRVKGYGPASEGVDVFKDFRT